MFKRLLVGGALGVASLGSWAVLIDQGPTTYDTASGLQWLDLSFTNGLSYNEVQSGFSAPGPLRGYRYATLDELRFLLPQLDVPVLSNYYSVSANFSLQKFDSYLGLNVRGIGPAYGFYARTGDSIPGYPGYHFFSSAFSNSINIYTPLNAIEGSNSDGYLVAYQQPSVAVLDSIRSTQIASFVVQAVSPIPEPSTYALTLAGLGLLIAARRHRVRSGG